MADPESIYYPTQKLTVNADQVGQRIDNYLLSVLKGVPKSHIYRILRKGEVRVNGGRKKPVYRLQENDLVRVPPVKIDLRPEVYVSKQAYDSLSGQILIETDDFLVLNKPSGLAVHSGSNVSYGVIEVMQQHHKDCDRIELVHRIDRGTSGCLLMAKSRVALNELQNAFRHGRIQKSYLALLSSKLRNKTVVVDKPLIKKETKQGDRVVVDEAGKSAYSEFHHYQATSIGTLSRVFIKTGRTHQIRVHAQSIGAALAGDSKYGDFAFNQQCKSAGLNRIFLHAFELSFTFGGEQYDIQAPLPEELVNFVEKHV